MEQKENTLTKELVRTGIVAIAVTTLASSVFLTGCDKKSDNNGEDEIMPEETKEEDMEFNQFDAPKSGEQIAIMHTSMGDIKFRLFPQYAPKSVENFVTLSKEGKYDGMTFHRVIKDFMIQSGDYTSGDGYGGKSIWGDTFEDECDEHVLLYTGALAMANTGYPGTNGSQFFIVQAGDVDEMLLKQMKQAGLPSDWIEGYKKNGGTPHLDFRFTQYAHTVFGQVYEGMDIVDKIASVQTDENDKPISDVIVNSIDIEVME